VLLSDRPAVRDGNDDGNDDDDDDDDGNHGNGNGNGNDDGSIANQGDNDGGNSINGINVKKWREEFYYEWTPPNESIKFPISTALVRKDFKYIRWPQFGLEQLFHLAEDPMEETNLVVTHDTYRNFTSILSEMRIRHDELQEAVK